MLDARNIYRKVTRKIYDFSPEQEQNLLAIVWLYRGQTERFLNLVAGYCQRMLAEGEACFTCRTTTVKVEPLPDFLASLAALRQASAAFSGDAGQEAPVCEALQGTGRRHPAFTADVEAFQKAVAKAAGGMEDSRRPLTAHSRKRWTALPRWPKPAATWSSRPTCSTSLPAG